MKNPAGVGGRREKTRGGLIGLFDRIGWSMTVWLIVVNCAVFVFGVILSQASKGNTWVPGPVQFEPGVSVEAKARAVAPREPTQVVTPTQIGSGARPVAVAPVFDSQTRQLIGQQQFSQMTLDQAWGHFSTATFFKLEVWRFVTFQFLHASIMHLLLNMVGLWVFGPDVEQYLGRKRYLALYLVCGIFGALAFLALNFLGNTLGQAWKIPGLLFDDITTPLVGASAGIFGIILAAAYVAPQRVIYILGILPLRQRPAAWGMLVISAIQLFMGSQNAGGEAAHIGGAMAGYFFIRRMYLLRDFFDVLGPDAPPPPKPTGKPRLRITPPVESGGPPVEVPVADAAEVDRILAKIKASGRESLTETERSALARATDALKATTGKADGRSGVGGNA